MLSFLEFSNNINELVTKAQLDTLEKELDAAFAKNNIDFDFSRHFFDQVNDQRNKKDIEIEELRKMFLAAQKSHGDKFKKAGAGFEAIITDFNSNINSPFALKWDSKNNELDLVAKTVMRKKGFVSNANEPIFKVY